MPYFERDEVVTTGRVMRIGAGTGPVLVHTIFVGGGLAIPGRFHREEFAVMTDSGVKLRVNPRNLVAWRPQRRVRGRWRDLRSHPGAPDVDLPPGRRVRFDGFWLEEGDRIAICGWPIGAGFVDGTGGPRQAPRMELRRVDASAIGAGRDPATELVRALRDRRRALAAAPEWPRRFALGYGMHLTWWTRI